MHVSRAFAWDRTTF